MKNVKCCVTGEVGTIDNFYKVGGKFYKSKEIYDEVNKDKNNRKLLHKIITEEFLNNDASTGGYLGKKLKDIKINSDVLVIIFNENKDKLLRNIQKINNNMGKINYIFKVINEQISR
jgi:hypothetical protein